MGWFAAPGGILFPFWLTCIQTVWGVKNLERNLVYFVLGLTFSMTHIQNGMMK